MSEAKIDIDGESELSDEPVLCKYLGAAVLAGWATSTNR